MASEAILEITDANFDAMVTQSDQPVLVDFWAEWCMPCRILGPIIEELAEDYQGKIRVGKLDTDANRETAMNFQINAIPTVMLFKDGEVVKKFVGVTNKQNIAEAIDAVL